VNVTCSTIYRFLNFLLHQARFCRLQRAARRQPLDLLPAAFGRGDVCSDPPGLVAGERAHCGIGLKLSQ
jgi:hypothetical protein